MGEGGGDKRRMRTATPVRNRKCQSLEKKGIYRLNC